MNEKETIRLGKFLSLVLRHQPQTIDLTIDEQGWAAVDELLGKLKQKGYNVDFSLLQQIVETNNKKRFAFNEDRTKIRASQGHSIKVELDYEGTEPPVILYHGSAEQNISAIVKEGLHKKSRHHVHLSADIETAIKVGQRHGRPVVFEVLAKEMHDAGHLFYLSANGVWLTDSVPPAFLRLLK